MGKSSACTMGKPAGLLAGGLSSLQISRVTASMAAVNGWRARSACAVSVGRADRRSSIDS